MKIFGQDLETLRNQISAIILNLWDWIQQFFPKWLKPTPLPEPESNAVCVTICRPGSLKQLQYTDIPGGVATVGYNMDGFKSQFVPAGNKRASYDSQFEPTHVLVKTDFFSVNYADVCIRWGLYESALRYIGWPIVPGFDFSGTVIWAGADNRFKKGDRVFGFTMFGAYSSRILVPGRQIRLIPDGVDSATAAAIPAVAGTALHAVHLAGAWPKPVVTRCKAVLIHSAAGGVGSMLIQMCKLCGFSPVVGVVGAPHKVDICYKLGADVVIDKSKYMKKYGKTSQAMAELDSEIRAAASGVGYIAVFDANGVESLQQSFEQLSRCGRVITYGFHSNLPRDVQALSPYRWLKMIFDMATMPKFDPMAMVLESKAVLGFNLSFFADEHELIEQYMNQLDEWLNGGLLKMADVTVFEMKHIAEAHKRIQSGQSVGKIVIQCP